MPSPLRSMTVLSAAAATVLLAACVPTGGTLPISAPSSGEASAPQPSPSVPASPTAEPSPGPSAPSTEGTTAGNEPTTPAAGSAAEQLALVRASSPRNTDPDGQEHRDTPQAAIPFEDYLGPWSEHVDNYEGSVPFQGIGTSRLHCEFSHFSYDDPLKYPGLPGAAHLHMFFGNADVNAFTTAESLRDSGGSTCNGFVRNGYWVPALVDSQGNARVPSMIMVYYKGYGEDLAGIQAHPDDMAMISDNAINLGEGSDGDSVTTFQCISASAAIRTSSETVPECVGQSDPLAEMIEFNVKFDNCWNGEDPTNWEDNLAPTQYSWYSGNCPETHPIQLTNLEYRIRYELAPGESTAGWYLSSDVDPMTNEVRADRGGSAHADWWGAWDPRVGDMWLENCVRVGLDCANGALTPVTPSTTGDEGVTALKRRVDYTGPTSVPVTDLFDQLCRSGRAVTTPEEAAHCDVGPMMAGMGH
ncbi:MAG: DUF1996 domain-containing protein [Kineosporiaceae bacterium]